MVRGCCKSKSVSGMHVASIMRQARINSGVFGRLNTINFLKNLLNAFGVD